MRRIPTLSRIETATTENGVTTARIFDEASGASVDKQLKGISIYNNEASSEIKAGDHIDLAADEPTVYAKSGNIITARGRALVLGTEI